VPFTIQKRDRIIAAVNTRYLSRSHKFVIVVPKTGAEALDLDKNIGKSYWQEPINLEAKNVDVVLQELEDSEQVPVGYQFVECHMIFVVIAGSLKRKARYVAGGHMAETPSAI
jgi:hypothetical protein